MFIISVAAFAGLISYEKKCMQQADQYWKAKNQNLVDQYRKAKRNQDLAEENHKKAYSDNLNDPSPIYINDAVDTYFLATYLAGDSGCDSGCDSTGNSTGDFGGFGDSGGW